MCCMLLAEMFSSGAAFSQKKSLDTDHISIDMEYEDVGWTAYIFTRNEHTSNVYDISYTVEFTLKCGGTKTYSDKFSLKPGGVSPYGGVGVRTIGIPEVKDCKNGVQSARLTSFSAVEQKKESAPSTGSTSKPGSGMDSWGSTTNNKSNSGSSSINNSTIPTNSTGTVSNPQLKAQTEQMNRVNSMKAQEEMLRKQQEQENYNRVMAYEQKRQESIQKTNQIVEGISNGLIAINNQLAAERQRKRDEEDRKREEEDQRAREKAAKEEAFAQKIAMRKKIIAEFKPKEVPLSSSPEKATSIYYFIYAYDSSSLTRENTVLYLSNVFEIGKYPDGTWPYRSTIHEEVKALSPYREVMHGYYYNVADAEKMRQSFRELFSLNEGVVIKEIHYKGKPSKTGAPTNFWNSGSNKQAAGFSNPKPATGTAPAKEKQSSDFWEEKKKTPVKTDSASKKKDLWD